MVGFLKLVEFFFLCSPLRVAIDGDTFSYKSLFAEWAPGRECLARFQGSYRDLEGSVCGDPFSCAAMVEKGVSSSLGYRHETDHHCLFLRSTESA